MKPVADTSLQHVSPRSLTPVGRCSRRRKWESRDVSVSGRIRAIQPLGVSSLWYTWRYHRTKMSRQSTEAFGTRAWCRSSWCLHQPQSSRAMDLVSLAPEMDRCTAVNDFVLRSPKWAIRFLQSFPLMNHVPWSRHLPGVIARSTLPGAWIIVCSRTSPICFKYSPGRVIQYASDIVALISFRYRSLAVLLGVSSILIS